ncbi:DUF4435 domain-containing protein [Pseudomonas viridiflava]|uniref:DUF4435 domain-containing protein n=1 Tax=Pseudomonas viridiflava TaxID=33069 RepID=UPI000F0412CE|nr:DUF4435 domain-containing protein [Pseudomonas viridiflava]
MDDVREIGFVISSHDIEKLRLFNSDASERETVIAWVESLADKKFWGLYLKDNERYKFHLKIGSDHDSQDGLIATGCKRLLALKNRGEIVLGKNNIFCLDSDYNFLVSLHQPLENMPCDHIYYTNIHSIENAFLNPIHTDETLVNVTASRLTDLTLRPSEIITAVGHDTFELVKLISFSMAHDPETAIDFNKSLLKEITALKMTEIDEPLSNSVIYKKFKLKISELTEELLNKTLAKPGNNYSEYEQAIRSAGVNSENAYLFIRGHNLYEMVVTVCEKISKSIRSAEIAKIKIRHAKPQEAVNAVHNEWQNYGASLKSGYFTANLRIEFLCNTYESLQGHYG